MKEESWTINLTFRTEEHEEYASVYCDQLPVAGIGKTLREAKVNLLECLTAYVKHSGDEVVLEHPTQ